MKKAFLRSISGVSIFFLSFGLIFSGCGKKNPDRSDVFQSKQQSSTDSTKPALDNGADNRTGELTANEPKLDFSAIGIPEEYSIEDIVRSPKSLAKGDGSDKVTVMIYMNGSNLESESGFATDDIDEILDAGYSENVNILIQTMGTSQWMDYDIASDHSQIYRITEDGFTLVNDTLEQLPCTHADTLRDFINWSTTNYTADRYMLIFWNHGGGPVIGYGSDEMTDSYDTLTLDEIQAALLESGTYFDFIGMDACLMSSLEVACALYDFCDYTILSEDFESGFGWYYTPWLEALYENPSISIEDLGPIIVDALVSQNEMYSEFYSEFYTEYYEEPIEIVFDSSLSVIDEGWIPVLYAAWVDFAYENTNALLNANYSREETENGRNSETDKINKSSAAELSEYFVTDIMAVAQNIDSEKSQALSAALAEAITYMAVSEENSHLTGLSVTLPYGDKYFYSMLKDVFLNSGFDEEYVTWLGQFVTADGSDNYYDYSEWDTLWQGWTSFINDFDWSSWSFITDPGFWNSLNIDWSNLTSQDTLSNWYQDFTDTYGNISIDNLVDLAGTYYEDFFSSDASESEEDYYYDEESDTSYYYDDELEMWYTYDEEDELWYYFSEDSNDLIIYDESVDMLYYYDSENDSFYYYDETEQDWILIF